VEQVIITRKRFLQDIVSVSLGGREFADLYIKTAFGRGVKVLPPPTAHLVEFSLRNDRGGCNAWAICRCATSTAAAYATAPTANVDHDSHPEET
jgi:hypothetical protein